jgi:glyoxylate/hydroxypyruvate reductase A
MSVAFPEILVFCPEPEQAERYRELILARHPGAPVVSASSAQQAEPYIDRAEILLGWKVPAALLRRATRLRWMQKTGAGVEDLVLGNALPEHVRLTRCDGVLLAPRMIEYVLGAIYARTQKFHLAWTQQGERVWQPYMVDRAEGSVLGVAGLGDIGGAIARRAVANGFKVIGWRRSPQAEPDLDRVFVGLEQLKAFVALCDYLVLVLPLTNATRDMFDADILSAAKQGCFLINVGRGGVIVEPALVNALRSGALGGAMLDVYVEEPLPTDHAFWTLPNLYMTPHVSGPIVPDDVASFFLDNLDLYRNGLPLLREVDRASGY